MRAEGGTMIIPQPVYPVTPYPEGAPMYEVLCGGWELVASFAEEIAAIAEPLRLSDHRRDQRIAGVVPPCLPSPPGLAGARSFCHRAVSRCPHHLTVPVHSSWSSGSRLSHIHV